MNAKDYDVQNCTQIQTVAESLYARVQPFGNLAGHLAEREQELQVSAVGGGVKDDSQSNLVTDIEVF